MKAINNSILAVLFFCCFRVLGQDTINLKPIDYYDFIKSEGNEIGNSVILSGFYEKLYQLKKNRARAVNLVHIGDSHIQADMITHEIRQILQLEFGNGGRGFVFPGRIARTNEPLDIHSTTNASWESKRIVFTGQPLPIGLGASTLRTKQPGAKFVIRTMNSPGLDYSFNNVSLFFLKDTSSYNLILNDSLGHQLAYAGPYTKEVYPNYSFLTLPLKMHDIEFQTVQPTNKQEQFTLFGMSLSNGNPGILYHSIGGNGAKFKHFLAAQYFVEQTTALNPDLFIISLGTNEAAEYPYIDKQFLAQAETFLIKLKQANPNALFIITTPADFYRKRTRRNPGVEQIHIQLLQLANKINIALWDLYEVGGGRHSADDWKKNNLMQKDGVHFTKAGYELQGDLFYRALIKGYNEYVRYRYP